MHSTPSSEAQSLFANFLSAGEQGESVDLEDLCARHPEHAGDLRRLWEVWKQKLEPAFSFFQHQEREGDKAGHAGPVRAGDRIGDFHLDEILARGGQGEVWIAEQLSLGRKVALKLILPERATGKSRALFAREARAGGRLSHPGIVAVYDHGVSGGHDWIAMELVEGCCTLRDSLDEIRAERELPPDYYRRAAELVAQVADALQAAHEAGVIHRDVKPQNILITKDDQPKLTDFGLARIRDETALSRTGDFVGTYAYMSPEQVAARRAGIDHRTDIFSLGIVTYEILSLRRPFTGETSHEIAEQILTVEPPDLHRVQPGIPRDLAVICGKCLSKDRRDRYPTMAELAAELRRFLADEPIRARPPSAARRLRRWVRRHPAPIGVASTAGAAMLLYLANRPSAPVPFTGPGYEKLIVASSPADERSPTFVGNSFLVFERSENHGDAPGLWLIDLSSGLQPRAWSPPNEVCMSPSVSPDGRWLAYETLAQPDVTGLLRTAIVIRRLEEASSSLEWPAEDHRRVAPETGSVGGVRWSRRARFLYTHTLGESQILRLHDLAAADGAERELERMPLPDTDPEPIHACFSPEEDRVLVATEGKLRTLVLDPEPLVTEIRTLDCGTYRDPVWLRDDSILLSRGSFKEASSRLYRLTRTGAQRLREFETHLIGGFTGLAVSADESMLALEDEVETASLFVWSPEDDPAVDPRTGAHSALPPGTTAPVTSYPPGHVIWTPDERIIFSGDTAHLPRLFVLDLETGTEAPLELEVEGLSSPWDSLHLDQPAFSQNGKYFVCRAVEDPVNEKCDRQEWIVVSAWPPEKQTAIAFSMGIRRIAFPHVDDAGDQVVWTESVMGQVSLFTARLEGRFLVDIVPRRAGVSGLARLSGDGTRIAFPVLIGFETRIAVIAWDGTEVATIGNRGVNMRPMWLPDEPDHLAFFYTPDFASDLLSVWMVAMDNTEHPLKLCGPFSHLNDPSFVTFAPDSGRVTYAVRDEEPGNIWLVRTANPRR